MALLFCFFPTAIVAIIKNDDAKKAWARGDQQKADADSKTANTFLWISCGIGTLLWIGCIILFILPFLFFGGFLWATKRSADRW